MLVAALLLGTVARAQRANDNAVTAASDAFGTVVGTQTIGLYSPTNARGFSPSQAENLRIEGLYFDQRSSGSNPYLFSGSDMRVGIAAQSYAFPSPSGIADLRLRTPGDDPLTSAVLIRGPLDVSSVELDVQYPLAEHLLRVGLIAGAAHGFDYNYALKSNRRAISLLLKFTPGARTEVLPFIGYVHNTEWQETPFVFTDGVHPVPVFDEQHLPIQNWTTWRWDQTTAGAIARVVVTDAWAVRAGLFRSIDRHEQNFNDLMLGPTAEGRASHVMDVQPAMTASSTSGDLRFTRSERGEQHGRELTLAVRGRHVDRNFGGDSVTDLGPISLYRNVVLPEPPIVLSAQSVDRVRQTGFGINDVERWSDRAALSVGILRTNYTRTVELPGLAASVQQTSVTLPTISFSLRPLAGATFYGSYTRGLEDSPNAPSSALNRGEPTPATPTWQVDAGVRVVAHRVQLLLGAFEVHKTYFALDTSDRYAAIGDISARGLESSATWSNSSGLTLVGGAVWLRPQVSRHAAELGASGDVPIGPVPGTVNLNVDYAPGGPLGWGGSLQWTWLSARVETTDDRYRLPPLNTLNVGIRYATRLFSRLCSARFDIGNVTNASGLTFSSAYYGLAVPQLPRNYTLTLAADL
jgi:iron complex outermembrane receptor protein